jgi:hypothetical protein
MAAATGGAAVTVSDDDDVATFEYVFRGGAAGVYEATEEGENGSTYGYAYG